LRRADRASLAPPASAIESLVGTGQSSISSLSAVGISRPSQDGLSAPNLDQPSPLRRARVPLALALLALGVGGAAFAITRGGTDKVEPHPAAPAPVAPVVETQAPEVKVEPPAAPTVTATSTAPDPPPVDSASGASRTPKGTPRATTTTQAPAAPPTQPKKRGAWRQDPGF